MFGLALGHTRHVLTALSTIGFGWGTNRTKISGRLDDQPADLIEEKEATTMFRYTVSYLRYALSTLSAVAFGINLGN